MKSSISIETDREDFVGVEEPPEWKTGSHIEINIDDLGLKLTLEQAEELRDGLVQACAIASRQQREHRAKLARAEAIWAERGRS